MSSRPPSSPGKSSDQLRAVNPDDFATPSEGAAYDRIHAQLDKFILAWKAVRNVMETLIEEIEISREDDRSARSEETKTRTRLSLLAILFICIHMVLTTVVIRTSIKLTERVDQMRVAMDESTARIREAQSAQLRSQIILSLPEVKHEQTAQKQIEEVIETAVEVAPDDESKKSANELRETVQAIQKRRKSLYHMDTKSGELETIEVTATPLAEDAEPDDSPSK